MIYFLSKNKACGNLTPYFRHFTENRVKNLSDFGTREPDVQKMQTEFLGSSLCWGLEMDEYDIVLNGKKLRAEKKKIRTSST